MVESGAGVLMETMVVVMISHCVVDDDYDRDDGNDIKR